MSAGSVASLVPISEAELQTAIIDCAVALGWLVYHTHDSRHSPEGFPDLILVREPRLIIAELKGVDRRGRPGVVKVAQAERQTYADSLRIELLSMPIPIEAEAVTNRTERRNAMIVTRRWGK